MAANGLAAAPVTGCGFVARALHVAHRARGDLVLGDRVGALGALHVDQRRLADDQHLVLQPQRGLLQFHVETGGLAVADGDAGELLRLVAHVGHADGVVARAEAFDAVVAVKVGGRAARRAEHEHARVDDGEAGGRVGDGASDGALRGSGHGGEQHEQRHGQPSPPRRRGGTDGGGDRRGGDTLHGEIGNQH